MLDEHNVYKEVTEIVLLDIVTTIKDYTFEGFNNITSITLPESITSIGYCAFSGCNSLTNIMLPENVTSIVVDAFLDGAFGDGVLFVAVFFVEYKAWTCE